jgi:hypothetical protein
MKFISTAHKKCGNKSLEKEFSSAGANIKSSKLNAGGATSWRGKRS